MEDDGAPRDDGSGTRTRVAHDRPRIARDAPATRAVLHVAIEEAVSLLGATGGFVYLLDDGGQTLELFEDAGVATDLEQPPIHGLRLPVGAGIIGRAVADGRTVGTTDYATDASFTHTPETDRVAAELGIVSMIAAPLLAADRTLGALAAFAGRRDAFTDAHRALIRTLAAHAASTLENAALIEALERSTAHLARRSEQERALRELVGSLATIQDPEELLKRVVGAAATVVGARGALIDRIDQFSHLHLTDDAAQAAADGEPQRTADHGTAGIMGLAMAEGRVVATGDYERDRSFVHSAESDELARRLGLRSVVAAPLVSAGETLGVLAAHSDQPDAFDQESIALIAAFADHAAIAIANARQVAEIKASRGQLARRAFEEQALREIGSTLTAIRNVDEVLELAVREVNRVVGAEWAEIARVEPDRRIVLTHDVGLDDPELRAAQRSLDLRVGDGLIGLAVSERRTVATGDYLADRSFTHRRAADSFARRAGFRSLIAAPLIVGAEVLGVLAVHSSRRNAFDEGHLALVADFANVAAVAMGNARLIEALDRSEARYRDLLAASPDVVFVVDADGRFTFLSDTLERQLGWPAAAMVGRHFSALIDVQSMGDAERRWQDLRAQPGVVLNARFNLIHRDGRRIPFEIRSSGLEADGRFVGVQGSARDISEGERLERELRESEERYRYLVRASPDVVWAVDADGRFTFLSDRLEGLTGFRPEELIGHHFRDLTEPGSIAASLDVWAAVQRQPTGVYPLSIHMPRRDGPPIPVEIWVTGRTVDGRFAGAHGSIRDMRERERLERDLRRHAADLAASEERAHLARELHDSVTQALFSMSLVAKSIEMLIDHDPALARARLATLVELQQDALAEMRALIFELRPASLETAGLVDALRTHVAAIEGRTGLTIVLETDCEERLPGEFESALFRIGQEALNNVIKHARAHEVHLAIVRGTDAASLVVEDDGVGFDPDQVPAGHLGLAGMRARAEKLGGWLELRTRPGEGTTLRVVVPLEPKRDLAADAGARLAGAQTRSLRPSPSAPSSFVHRGVDARRSSPPTA